MNRSPLSKLRRPVHPLRAVAEAVGLAAAVLGLLLLALPHAGLVALAALGVGSLCAGLGALRARLSAWPWPIALRDEAGSALAFMLSLGLVLQGLWLARSASAPSDEPQIQTLILISAGLSALTFFIVRLIRRLEQLWQTARRRRLRWAMLQAHLLTLLALLLLFLGVQAVRFWLSGPSGLIRATGPATTLLQVSTTLFILIGTTIIAIPLLALVIGLAALMSDLTARPIIRRIEALAGAVNAFRQGGAAPPLALEGQDEIAQLSADFQAMAVELRQTLADLQTERDRVAGLLRARRELIAGVSHELRTPTTTMRSYLESLLSQESLSAAPTLRRDLETIQAELLRLQQLIEDLLTLSRAEVGQLALRCEPIEPGPLIQGLVETAAPLAWQSGRVRLVADLPPDLPPLLADPGRLEQILRNLIHNGVRHTPPGGIVAISAQVRPGQVWLEVHDTGEGIPPEALPHIWERFYRGANRAASDSQAGLGLALVKELTEAMGGAVAVESIAGQGSRFTIRLPRPPA